MKKKEFEKGTIPESCSSVEPVRVTDFINADDLPVEILPDDIDLQDEAGVKDVSELPLVRFTIQVPNEMAYGNDVDDTELFEFIKKKTGKAVKAYCEEHNLKVMRLLPSEIRVTIDAYWVEGFVCFHFVFPYIIK